MIHSLVLPWIGCSWVIFLNGEVVAIGVYCGGKIYFLLAAVGGGSGMFTVITAAGSCMDGIVSASVCGFGVHFQMASNFRITPNILSTICFINTEYHSNT